MKKLLTLTLALLACGALTAQTLKPIRLSQPNLERGKNIMQTLKERRSIRTFAATPLTTADLSDLLWAANGVSSPDGKRTAPSAMNRQEIELYVCFAEGAYRYDARTSTLQPVAPGDFRPVKEAPVSLILVGPKDFALAPVDAGIVSQNISLFCAGVGLATVPRASHDLAALTQGLKLTDNQTVFLNHPVGYFKK